MTRKIFIVRAILILLYMLPGWFLNDGYRYVRTVYYKATVCDELKCLEAKQMAADMQKLELPALKKERKDESKVQE